MKIRKTAKVHIATAMVLSAALLFAGCGTNTPKEALPNIVEEETSQNESLMIENDIKSDIKSDIKEENQDKNNE